MEINLLGIAYDAVIANRNNTEANKTELLFIVIFNVSLVLYYTSYYKGLDVYSMSLITIHIKIKYNSSL